jgi:hypothetical protein
MFCLVVFYNLKMLTSNDRNNNEYKSDDDYSHIGKFCGPNKIAELPCLKEICSKIDHQIEVWKSTNGSVASKLQNM